MSGFAKLDAEVIRVGLCTDCGHCAGVCPEKSVVMNYSTELPELRGECRSGCELCYKSCPGKDIPMPDLDVSVFGRQRTADEALLGVSQAFIKGYAVDPSVRSRGAGGGVVSALLMHALQAGVIDAAIVVGMSEKQPWRAVPQIAVSSEQILAAAKTKESVVPVNEILGQAIEKGYKKIGFVGLPCHVHAIRKMQMHGEPKNISSSIKLVIGLLCGANFSYRATEHVIEELAGVRLDQVARLEYRAGEYPGDFTVTTKSGQKVICPVRSRWMHDLGFRRDRCYTCYDYANELADVSVGDYWNVAMARGVPGISTAIVRTEVGKGIIDNAAKSGFIHTEPVEKEDFFRGGFELKKHGAAHQIIERRSYGWPTPDFHMTLDQVMLQRRIAMLHPLVA